jgi:3-deoxy-D-manno-octulosonic-acid transferase
LINSLLERFSNATLAVTTTTPTGSLQIRSLFADRVFHVYAPVDLPGAVRRTLDRLRPQLVILMETELWPNLIHQAYSRGIPVILANARLSERSARGYGRVGRLTRQMLGELCAIATQTADDARRFMELGAERDKVSVAGSVKFDVSRPTGIAQLAAALRQQWGPQRPVWIAASTHAGEEEMVLAAFETVRQGYPDALLLLVPRHPERFGQVAGLVRTAGFQLVRRSSDEAPTPSTQVYLADTMGELTTLYGAAELAFVGGSLVPIGGHNALEPAALGIPIITGPHVFNFAEITALLADAGALRQIKDVRGLAHAVLEWLQAPQQRTLAGEAGRRVVEGNRGALRRLLAVLDRCWTPTDRSKPLAAVRREPADARLKQPG